MTETITIDGKDYEVLTLTRFDERLAETTHARIAGGDIIEARIDPEYPLDLLVDDPDGFLGEDALPLKHRFSGTNFKSFGIQPLKLIERKPVRIHGEVASCDIAGWVTLRIPSLSPVKVGQKFDLVTKEEA